MLFSTMLASLAAAGSAYAAVAEGSWAVRADFTRCNGSTPLEAVLGGASDESSLPLLPASSVTPNVTDFRIAAPFAGSLVIKPHGAAGFGSPYPPQQVDIEVFNQPAGNPAVWSNATVKAGTQWAPIAKIGWNTGNSVPVDAKQKEDVSVQSTANGGTLVVYYCGAP
ncbi:hypothetical protein LX32DRAFT_635572 [Colletotrichum zoysiae]|uniref:Uncharacterized protein n=1 Tax=Colletotrichum zoysiae TaxID=1216348 RepID=A0AAD9HSH2_9PEZI|nr:hypothetical protein LX32DRAFT_635572 [Colletotrichum zoysiae]